MTLDFPSIYPSDLFKACVLFGAIVLANPTKVAAQELNCSVQVIAPQIANVEPSVFESLEDGIREFMNGRRWTNDNFSFDELIECTMQITISEAIGNTRFSGSIQI
ncbi:MAG: type IX secretion component PorD family protein, partial [Flavobacteriales bacterium]